MDPWLEIGGVVLHLLAVHEPPPPRRIHEHRRVTWSLNTTGSVVGHSARAVLDLASASACPGQCGRASITAFDQTVLFQNKYAKIDVITHAYPKSRFEMNIIVVPMVFCAGVALLHLLRHGPRLLQSMADPPGTAS